MAAVLVIDDEAGIRQSFKMILKDAFDVYYAASGKEALTYLGAHAIDLVLLDVILPDINGLELLKMVHAESPRTEIIMVTAVRDIQTAVESIKSGAYEYIVKPFDVGEVLTVINRALEKRRMTNELMYLRGELERFHPFEKMVGADKKMREVYAFIDSVSQSDSTVLIQGESGTGKELVARAIQKRSQRSSGPFVVINCAAIPETLMESELFGYNRGAFTGASCNQLGKLEIAGGGTVFLDDIDSLSVNMQAKLLRLIQEKEFQRLGSTRVLEANVRFIAACNKNMTKLIADGSFREDLYYRLNVLPIHLPPLRARKGDIAILFDHFFYRYSRKTGQPIKKLSKRALGILITYRWPGNVRELENLAERLCIIVENSTIMPRDIAGFCGRESDHRNLSLKEAVRRFEKQYITDVLVDMGGCRKKAAEHLGVHRNTLLSKMNAPL